MRELTHRIQDVTFTFTTNEAKTLKLFLGKLSIDKLKTVMDTEAQVARVRDVTRDLYCELP